jgi:hypothetical protein
VNRHAGLRFEGPGEVLRGRVSLLVGAAILFATSFGLGMVGAPPWGPVIEQTLAVWLLLAFSLRSYRVAEKGVVFADSSGLRVGERVVVERARIAAAFLLSPDDPVVRIFRRGALSVDVRLESEDQARAMVTALGLGIGESIATFSASYGGWARGLGSTAAVAAGAGAVGAAIALLHGGARASTTAAATIAFVLVVALSVRSFARVDVGRDGVLVRRPGVQRFLSYRVIESAYVDGRNVLILVLKSGENISLSLGISAAKRQLCHSLVERIEEARTTFGRDDGLEGAEALVAPGGRAPARWLREVRALAGARDYRETRLDEERLWQVLDDVTAPRGTRAGAALALSALDQASRTRLRVSADACAEPKLRVALTRVAEGATDAELEEALTPLLESKS